MSMLSNVGNPQVYNDGDQKNFTTNKYEHERYEKMDPERVHVDNDPLDEGASFAQLRSAREKSKRGDKLTDQERMHLTKDPTSIAMGHGNKPGRGAIVDKNLQQEDEELIRRKAESKASRDDRKAWDEIREDQRSHEHVYHE